MMSPLLHHAPGRDRGLKHAMREMGLFSDRVALSRGRGLKLDPVLAGQIAAHGRPFTGAWIETLIMNIGRAVGGSPLHGGVD